MPSGYDFRQPVRDSFASQPRAPVQGNSGPQVQQRGVQLVGGNTRGGMVAAGPQTDPINLTSELGSFFDTLLKPHLEKKQYDQYFKGFNAMMSGASLEEIGGSKKGLSKIFGPTAFQEGAQFYAAQDRINQYQNDLAHDEELKKLPPDEMAKVLAEKARGMLTGNDGADRIIQQSFLQSTGPTLGVIAKERYKFKQTEALGNWAKSGRSGATGLQSIMGKVTNLTDPEDPTTIAAKSAVQNFAASMAQPEGMDSETYEAGMYDFMVDSMRSGNFYAVQVMRSKGIDGIFNDETRTKLENAYERYGAKAQADAMNNSPELLDEYMKLNYEMKTETIGNPVDAANRLREFNNKIARMSGVQTPFFDWKEQAGAANTVVETLVSGARRAEARQQQIEDRDFAAAQRKAERQEEEDTAQTFATTIWRTGTSAEGKVADTSVTPRLDKAALADYNAGNFESIALNSKNGFISAPLSGIMQASVKSAVGSDYTSVTEKAYKDWSKLYAIRPAAAKGYYGVTHQVMLNFDKLVKIGHPPQIAWGQAGRDTVYSAADIPQGERKEVAATIDRVMRDRTGSWYTFGLGSPVALNKSSQKAVNDAIWEDVAVTGRNSGVGYGAPAEQALENGANNGRFEIFGKFAVVSKEGTPQLSKLLKVSPTMASKVFNTLLASGLKTKNFKEGLDGDNYSILRGKDTNGDPIVSVLAYGKDGEPNARVIIPFSAMKAQARAMSQNTRMSEVPAVQARKAASTAVQNKLDPYRRIPGETGWARTVRINREVAAGASPTKTRK